MENINGLLTKAFLTSNICVNMAFRESTASLAITVLFTTIYSPLHMIGRLATKP